jgi:hypothetical protein
MQLPDKHDLLRAFLVTAGVVLFLIGMFASDQTKEWASALVII